MEVYHKNKLILKNCKVAKNFFQKSFGLMFCNFKKLEKGMFFDMRKKGKYSITTFFCFYKFCIIFLDENKKIIGKKILNPFTFNYTCKKKFRYVVESSIEKFKKLKVEDKLNF